MHILHLNQRNQRNQILFQYLRDKEKKERRGLRKRAGGGGVKIHPFHLPWIRACRSRKWNRLSTWQNSTQNPSPNWGTFCNFSLAPKRKSYKTSMKHLKIHKFPFKNVIVLAIECKMYLKIQQKLHCLGCISKQTMRSVEKKTRLNSSKDDFLMKSFSSSTKRKLSILLNFLFPFFVF